MENETNTNKNSNSTIVWVIIGILVVAAIIVTVITTNLTSRPSDPQVEVDEVEYIDISEEDEESEINKEDEYIAEDEWEDIYVDMENSCLDVGGIFLEDNGCQIDESVYYNYDWQLAEEMILNCQENNGTWLGDQRCSIDGVVYLNNQWNNIEALQSLTSECNQAGGDWVDGYWECENVSENWCENAGGWEFDDCASSCRHVRDPEIDCTTECVSVCYF